MIFVETKMHAKMKREKSGSIHYQPDIPTECYF
jgi:hypothetical protein